MTSFEDALAAASTAPAPHKDVPVSLDSNIIQERERLIGALQAVQADSEGDQRLAAEDPTVEIRERLDALTEQARSSLVTIRVYRMPGDEWAVLTSVNPVRTESPLDMHYGYNYDAVTTEAAIQCSKRVEIEGGEERELPITREQWATMLKVLPGSSVAEIRSATWELNEFEPQERLRTLVKGFGAAVRSATK